MKKSALRMCVGGKCFPRTNYIWISFHLNRTHLHMTDIFIFSNNWHSLWEVACDSVFFKCWPAKFYFCTEIIKNNVHYSVLLSVLWWVKYFQCFFVSYCLWLPLPFWQLSLYNFSLRLFKLFSFWKGLVSIFFSS